MFYSLKGHVGIFNEQTKMLHNCLIDKDCSGNIDMPQGDNTVKVDLRLYFCKLEFTQDRI
jgi:hypothetical protein